MERIYVVAPWLMPLSMVVFNILYFTYGILLEGRPKMNTVRFAFLYASTIPAARRGDLEPFLLVFARPPD